MIEKYIKEFEESTGHKVVYVTLSGSKLYGTDSETSDSDYKGIFIPSKESVLLKTDQDVYTRDTNNTKEKNSADDIDFTLHSVYQFFNLLKKSETGSVDMMFSLFRKDTIVFEDKEFTTLIKNNYPSFINKNMKSFVGYALGQAKRFGIKGARYDELRDLVKVVDNIAYDEHWKLRDIFDILEDSITDHEFKYISTLMAPGPRAKNAKHPEIKYISVLGKMFSGDVTVDYFIARVHEQFDQFGNRTKTIADTESKTDFKALSHSLRIMREVNELIDTKYIKFPLTYADEIKAVKSGNCNVVQTIAEIEDSLYNVDFKLLTSDLPDEPDNGLINQLILGFYN